MSGPAGELGAGGDGPVVHEDRDLRPLGIIRFRMADGDLLQFPDGFHGLGIVVPVQHAFAEGEEVGSAVGAERFGVLPRQHVVEARHRPHAEGVLGGEGQMAPQVVLVEPHLVVEPERTRAGCIETAHSARIPEVGGVVVGSLEEVEPWRLHCPLLPEVSGLLAEEAVAEVHDVSVVGPHEALPFGLLLDEFGVEIHPFRDHVRKGRGIVDGGNVPHRIPEGSVCNGTGGTGGDLRRFQRDAGIVPRLLQRGISLVLRLEMLPEGAEHHRAVIGVGAVLLRIVSAPEVHPLVLLALVGGEADHVVRIGTLTDMFDGGADVLPGQFPPRGAGEGGVAAPAAVVKDDKIILVAFGEKLGTAVPQRDLDDQKRIGIALQCLHHVGVQMGENGSFPSIPLQFCPADENVDSLLAVHPRVLGDLIIPAVGTDERDHLPVDRNRHAAVVFHHFGDGHFRVPVVEDLALPAEGFALPDQLTTGGFEADLIRPGHEEPGELQRQRDLDLTAGNRQFRYRERLKRPSFAGNGAGKFQRSVKFGETEPDEAFLLTSGAHFGGHVALQYRKRAFRRGGVIGDHAPVSQRRPGKFNGGDPKGIVESGLVPAFRFGTGGQTAPFPVGDQLFRGTIGIEQVQFAEESG